MSIIKVNYIKDGTYTNLECDEIDFEHDGTISVYLDGEYITVEGLDINSISTVTK